MSAPDEARSHGAEAAESHADGGIGQLSQLNALLSTAIKHSAKKKAEKAWA